MCPLRQKSCEDTLTVARGKERGLLTVWSQTCGLQDNGQIHRCFSAMLPRFVSLLGSFWNSQCNNIKRWASKRWLSHESSTHMGRINALQKDFNRVKSAQISPVPSEDSVLRVILEAETWPLANTEPGSTWILDSQTQNHEKYTSIIYKILSLAILTSQHKTLRY